ncbi:MAG: High potential iron-sulfur protein [Oxalobacteraceae bacterium]|nr:High potential iron-sulfur protein [Oxalobacteraceae bacterium]
MVAETDSQAASLGYKADASKVDKAKYPRFSAGQQCANCSLYQGSAGTKAGACGIFPGKQVAASGWCSAYNKKA